MAEGNERERQRAFEGILPKGKDVTDIPDEIIQMYVSRFNTRPRKYLAWKPPDEIFHSTSLLLA